MNYKIVIAALVSMTWGTIQAQQKLTIQELISKVYSQNQLEVPEDFKLPWIEEVNIRTRTRDWMLKKQRYTLRLSPISFGERASANKLYKSWQQEIPLLHMKKVVERVSDIRKEWIDQGILLQEIAYNNEMIALLKDAEKVLIKESVYDANKLSELLVVRSELAKLQNQNQINQKKYDDILMYLSQQIEGDFVVISDSIDINMYLQSINELLVNEVDVKINAEESLDLSIIENEISLEKAEQNRVLDFVELQYQGPHDNGLNERIALGMSFNLPFYTSQKLSIAKLRVEKEVELFKIEQRKAKTVREVEEIKKSLREELFEYDSMNQLYAAIQSENGLLINSIEKQTIINPIVKINHRLQIIKNDLSLLELKQDIIELYLDFLEVTEKNQLSIVSIGEGK